MTNVINLFTQMANRPRCDHGLMSDCRECGPGPHDPDTGRGHGPERCDLCGISHSAPDAMAAVTLEADTLAADTPCPHVPTAMGRTVATAPCCGALRRLAREGDLAGFFDQLRAYTEVHAGPA